MFVTSGPIVTSETDANGNATHVIRFPNGNFSWSVEDFALRFGKSGLEWQASNTLDITCTK